MQLQEVLAKLAANSRPIGGFGTHQDEAAYAALDKAAGAGFVHKDRSRAKYGETWWSITDRGRAFLAQFEAAQ